MSGPRKRAWLVTILSIAGAALLGLGLAHVLRDISKAPDPIVGVVVDKVEMSRPPNYIKVGPFINATGGGSEYALHVRLDTGGLRVIKVSKSVYDSFWVGGRITSAPR